jgi:chemotaxis protein CheD
MSDAILAAVGANRYFDHNLRMDAVKLLPGEFFATQEKLVLVTVLGSCVAVCLRDSVAGIGGMNHFMLPEVGAGGATLGHSGRYGVFAMEVLINSVLKLGAQRSALEAKVFGGGAVMKELSGSNVGELNTSFAMEFLKIEGIKVAAKDVLGVFPRKVYFFPETGKVLVRTLKEMHNNTIIDRERNYRKRLSRFKFAGDEKLFG